MISNHMIGFAIASLSPYVLARLALLVLLVASLRDAAAAAPRRVLVDRAALRGAIEDARRFGYRAAGGLAALLDRVARGLHRRARRGASERLDRGAPRRLADALEGRALLLLGRHGHPTIAEMRGPYFTG